MVYMM